ncbi:MAG TPA: class I SAM-dependent RNA methyltransferase [Blastocatellia bacterium]
MGDIIEVTVERLAYGGDAVARYDGVAVFIPLAAPGDRLRVRIVERKKRFARAVIERVLEPSPVRREPPCEYFGDCGGCQLQHLTYEAQLEAKVGFVRDALERIGRIDWPHRIRILHGEEFGYRGRAQIKIDKENGRIGFNRARSNVVCDIKSCPILLPELNEALRSLRAVADEADVGQVEMAAGESSVSFEPSFASLPGGALRRTVRDAIYNFSPSTFFQANPGLLGELIDEAVGEASGDLAIDLYAGVGLFTIQLARRFKRVIGVESDREAVSFALKNLSTNNITNVECHATTAETWLASSISAGSHNSPDLVLLDPPRSGASTAIPLIATLQPSRIVYVSCDPATLARDLRSLIDLGFRIGGLSVIDLFPQTYHVETVSRLERSSVVM